MCDRSKLLVFLGAPPPAADSAARPEGEQRPPDNTWRHVELTWQDGHLRPATGEAFRDPPGSTACCILTLTTDGFRHFVTCVKKSGV